MGIQVLLEKSNIMKSRATRLSKVPQAVQCGVTVDPDDTEAHKLWKDIQETSKRFHQESHKEPPMPEMPEQQPTLPKQEEEQQLDDEHLEILKLWEVKGEPLTPAEEPTTLQKQDERLVESQPED